MSRIFTAVMLATALLVGAGALGVAHDESTTESEQLEGIVELFAMTIEISTILPLVMIAGLLLATLGVLART